MKLTIEIKCAMTLYAKQILAPLKINKIITQSWDEDSVQFADICAQYETLIGFECTDETEKEFYKELAEIISNEKQKEETEKTNRIQSVIKNSILYKTPCIIEFGGHIINPLDFSSFEFTDFKINVSMK